MEIWSRDLQDGQDAEGLFGLVLPLDRYSRGSDGSEVLEFPEVAFDKLGPKRAGVQAAVHEANACSASVYRIVRFHMRYRQIVLLQFRTFVGWRCESHQLVLGGRCVQLSERLRSRQDESGNGGRSSRIERCAADELPARGQGERTFAACGANYQGGVLSRARA
jgi:hypothetical protein